MAESLKELRQKRGLTVEALGVLGDIDGGTVSRIERGLVQPKRATVVKLARGLGISAKRMKAILEGSSDAA